MTGASHDLVAAIVAVGGFAIHLLTVLRAVTRPNRTPASPRRSATGRCTLVPALHVKPTRGPAIR